MEQTLLLGAAYAFVSALVYVAVGRTIQSRAVSAPHQLANTLFSIWWYALGLATLSGGIRSLAAYQDYTDLGFFTTATFVELFLICAALWGLLYYLIYLYTSKSNLIAPLSLGYLLYFFFLVYFVLSSQPTGVTVGPWTTQLAYAKPADPVLQLVLLVLLVGPQIGGAVGMFLLYFRAETREQKVRLLVVSLSIFIWFGSALVAASLHVSGSLAWQIASRLIGLGSAIAIYLVYQPPAFLRRRMESRPRDPTAPPEPPTYRQALPVALA